MSIGIFLLLLCFRGTSFCCGETIIGRYPLPLVEAEVLLTKWLQQEKYAVASQALANGDIELHGAVAGKLRRVLIRSHSPLATEIHLLETVAKADAAKVRLSWESYLARMEQVDDKSVPAVIRALAKAVVCISAPQADEKIMNFSGFLIDQSGTVLTIAHDINEQRLFRLRFPGGAVGEGRVTKSDAARDLSVIQSNHIEVSSFFPLKEGRTSLIFGERIYMLCCGNSGNIQIQAGTVDKPQAMVDGQKLWQVKLEQVFFGSSGSPVVDESGILVGVVKGRFRGADSRGFLIPVDTVQSFVEMGKR